ncbi:MAG: ferrous iron transport protein A [Scytonematopsis contorta HA4267-MV1]|jgi:ferrous iron transport protein A|nr:ferrous iron transport protein A [Scytonematopsis contorta HA4267-MV1]
MLENELSSLKVGDTAVIVSLSAETSLEQRLSALGFRVGKEVQIIRKAWLNGPLHVRLGTTEVMVRLRDAKLIKVTNCKHY